MIVKRLLAVAAAAALIVGALVVRNQVIDADDAGDDATADGSDGGDAPTVLVCVTELASACRAAAGGLTVRTAEAGETVDSLSAVDAGAAVLWVTFDPFPAMVDSARAAASRPALELDTATVVTSPIALVSSTPVADQVASCGAPADWSCVAALGVTTGFARTPDSGIGLLGLAQAASGYSSTGIIPFDDARFSVWLRALVQSVPASRMSGGTAVATIRSRASAMDVAVGAEAELGNPPGDALVATYAAPRMQTSVVVATSSGVAEPDGLTDRLTAALTADGWLAPGAPSQVPDAGTLLALRQLWKDSL